MKIDFSKTFPVAENYGFKFISQRTVIYKMASSDFTYALSKHDVIDAIVYFISELQSISKEPFKGIGMNFKAFKMHDLVPYLYTLINLYLTRRSSSITRYHHWLPELELSRFCHLPFNEEILMPVKEDIEVKVFRIDDLQGDTLYCAALYGSVEFASSVADLRSKLIYKYKNLFDKYNVIYIVSE